MRALSHMDLSVPAVGIGVDSSLLILDLTHLEVLPLVQSSSKMGSALLVSDVAQADAFLLLRSLAQLGVLMSLSGNANLGLLMLVSGGVQMESSPSSQSLCHLEPAPSVCDLSHPSVSLLPRSLACSGPSVPVPSDSMLGALPSALDLATPEPSLSVRSNCMVGACLSAHASTNFEGVIRLSVLQCTHLGLSLPLHSFA